MSGLKILTKLIGSACAIWTIPGNCRAGGDTSHHLVQFRREVGLFERVGASSEG